ncbi:acriflavin resistance protein [Magnetococcus marinus MC-1]|uniref:Acriflavin resistance protein n=1 Tax=Magnetococcus marinus (strain ATCC BAA-1437 / JCM 17883 / MC-1) TaxID=156889 RepID=A0LAN0_MAGMM|nr:efflux RND transporter permease subunit [Magnetococcus marinus]ABK45023.1 acriflavin resistance protein [Magnetococcus marinus MC-1]
MNLARISVARPVFTSMVTLMVVILGLVSLSRLQIDLLPSIELPTLSVRTQYEGASPEVMERLVTQIVEEIVATVPGVVEMTSQSSEGNSTVKVSFAWGTDIDTAALDVLATLEDEINELPEDITRPRVSKFDVDSFPVVILGISSDLDPVPFTQLIEEQIRYRFARIAGVAQVDVWGGYNRQVRIELDPDRLNALGIPLADVLTAVRNANLDRPAGTLEEGQFEITLRAPAEFVDLDEIRQTVVVLRDGVPVTLGQLAAVHDRYEKLTRMVRVDDRPGIRVAIRKQAEANTVEVAKRVLAEIEAVNQAYPRIHVVPVINQGNFIERSIANVARSVLYGGGLAVLVLLFFLGSVRSTVVISLAIPISIIATFMLLYFGGFTLNLMTLGGLALGVGMMVDSSVVVLENIVRRRHEARESLHTASLMGAQEVTSAIIASTITTLVIFLPLVFVRGVSGILFQELAYVIIFSLICSLLVSLSLVPMLISKLGRGGEGSVDLPRWADRWQSAMQQSYANLLQRVLEHRWKTVLAAVTLLAGSMLLLPYIGTEYLPPSDEGEVRITGEMAVGTRLELLDQQAQRMEAIVRQAVPEIQSSVVNVGRWRGKTNAEIRLALAPVAERSRSNVEIAADLRRRLAGQIPGMKVRTRAPQGQFLLERLLAAEEGITIEVRGYDLQVLDGLAQAAMAAIADLPGVTDSEASKIAGVPQRGIHIDRAKIADLGLSVQDVTSAIETAVAGSKAGEFRAAGNAYPILVQLADAEKRGLDEILDLTLRTPAGELVAIRNLVSTVAGQGPLVIDRKDQQRLVTVSANVAGRDLGSVAAEVQERLMLIPRPAGYDLLLSGHYEEQGKAFRELIISMLLALVLVYMVLASQYESLRDPIIVMLSVPMAAVGVLLMMFLTHTTFNLQTFIGCIMLVGIVVNNAILLVDQAGRLRQAGMSGKQAVTEAGRRRLRPILMTTLTTVLALLPLALGIGEGADMQAPLARAVISGLAGSMLITLVIIPVVYTLFHPDPAPGSTQPAVEASVP